MTKEAKCMVNHELADGVFFTLLDQHLETVAMLKQAVHYVKSALRESYWTDAEDWIDGAEAFVAKIDVGKLQEMKPGEEPF